MPPAPAVAAVRRAVRSCLETCGDRVLVACSGGADSLALAAATAFVAPRAGVRAGLITVDHGLQTDSAAQADRVAALGYEFGLDPVLQVRVEPGTDGGPEAAARAARYAALDSAATSLDAAVLLGHTRDDQAETVLLGLGRGSGPRSIIGMREVDGHYRRPLLQLPRQLTRDACTALGLTPWDDPHNTDPRYQRVRLRRDVLPLLDEVLQGGVVAALARTADLLRDDLDALDGWCAAVLAEVARASPRPDDGKRGQLAAVGEVAVEPLADLPRAVRTRVLRHWLAAAGAGPLTAERTAVVDALITHWHGQGPVDLPGGIAVARRSGRLVVQPSPRAQPQVPPGEM